MGWLAFLGNLPSAFWQSLINGMKTLAAGLAGMEWQKLINDAANSKKLSEQYKEALDAEKSVNSIPVNGAADRLRNSRLRRAD